MFTLQLQHAAQRTTPIVHRNYEMANVPIQIKRLVAEKIKAREKWQRTHDPLDENMFMNSAIF